MKLLKFRVRNFRSIEDSGDLTIEQVMCLVGKNESGKSALVTALAGFNPHPSTPVVFDRERDYPRRHWLDYQKRHPDNEAEVIETVWQLESPETEAIAVYFGPDALASDQVTAIRRYNNPDLEWRIPLRLRTITEYLLSEENLSYAERKGIGEVKNTRELRAGLENLSVATERQKALLERLRALPGPNATIATQQILELLLPKFLLLSKYDQMVGQVRLDNWADRVAAKDITISVGERIFVDFLNYAGITPNESIFSSTYETLNARCEAASNLITQQLAVSWSQQRDLEVEIRISQAEAKDPPPFNEGVIARVRVKDRSNRVSVQFAERSVGFVWFFSFMMTAALFVRRKESIIMVLDEPGLSLHGAAQEDLMLYIYEYLAPHFQVIYTTHSPFLVSAPENLRLLEVNSNTGNSELVKDFTQAKSETLLPVQAAGIWNGKPMQINSIASNFGSDRSKEIHPSIESLGANNSVSTESEILEAKDSSTANSPKSEESPSQSNRDESLDNDSSKNQSSNSETELTVTAAMPLAGLSLALQPSLVVARLEESLYLQTLSAVLKRRGREGLNDSWQICPILTNQHWIGELAKLYPLTASSGVLVLETTPAGHSTTGETIAPLVIENSLSLAKILNREEADIEDLFAPEFYINLVSTAYRLDETKSMVNDTEPLGVDTIRILPLVSSTFEQIAPPQIQFHAKVPAWYLFHFPELLDKINDQSAGKSLERAEQLFRVINKRLETA